MDIILAPKKNVILDATVFSSLMGCGRYVDLRFNHSLVTAKGKSNSLEIGSIAHKVLEVYYKHLIKGFTREQAIGQSLTAGQMYVTGCPHCSDHTVKEPICKHEPGEYPGVQNTPEENEKHLIGWRWVLKSCEQYFEHYKNDSWTPLFVETVRGEVLYEDDEIRVLWKAKFDLAVDTNNGIFPVDHKTFKQRRDKTKLSNQFIGQCLLMKTRNVIVNKFGFQTTLKPEERFTRDVVSYSADLLLEWQSETLPYYAYKYLQFHETGYWPPNWSHCDTMYGPCIFKGVCESDRGMRGEELRNNFIIGPKWDPTNERDE